ncbi:hypothetical protein CARN8_4280005 [mine drainage metagenome]|uniref:Uncharacterized protein n=1 Tax=mine drainage metagenome TaxID=410659 RepID=A0A3P3ZPP5_9ZZZZ
MNSLNYQPKEDWMEGEGGAQWHLADPEATTEANLWVPSPGSLPAENCRAWDWHCKPDWRREVQFLP